jgi:hypothetical protein
MDHRILPDTYHTFPWVALSPPSSSQITAHPELPILGSIGCYVPKRLDVFYPHSLVSYNGHCLLVSYLIHAGH